MKILYIILPLLVSVLVVITKRKIINAQSGKEYAYKEFIIDIVRFIFIAIISLAGSLYGNKIHVWPLIIDLFMLIVYILPFCQKNYDFTERKCLMGIWASCIIMLSMAIVMFQMTVGIYDTGNTTPLLCFKKGLSYCCIAIWCCFTAEKVGKGNKIKALINGLVNSFKDYKLNMSDYLLFSFLELFVFTGGNGFFPPIGIYGLHEIINKNKIKSILFVTFGNLCLFLRHVTQFWGDLAYIIYVLVAFIDILIHYIKFKKHK